MPERDKGKTRTRIFVPVNFVSNVSGVSFSRTNGPCFLDVFNKISSLKCREFNLI